MQEAQALACYGAKDGMLRVQVSRTYGCKPAASYIIRLALVSMISCGWIAESTNKVTVQKSQSGGDSDGGRETKHAQPFPCQTTLFSSTSFP
jgi:hypothetical protein